jgi:hypothetical protein
LSGGRRKQERRDDSKVKVPGEALHIRGSLVVVRLPLMHMMFAMPVLHGMAADDCEQREGKQAEGNIEPESIVH